MTNEPPTDGAPDAEGEGLVEADLPGMSDRVPDPPEPDHDQLLEDARQQPFEDPTVRRALETEISAESRARQAEADQALLEELQNTPQQPFEDARIREAIETTISPESRAARPPDPAANPGGEDLVEADLPTTSSPRSDDTPPTPAPEAETDPLEAIDRSVEEWSESLDEDARTRREQELQSYRDEYGPEVDAEAMRRFDKQQPSSDTFPLFERILPSSFEGRVLTLILAAMGSAAAIFAAFAIFGGGSDDNPATSLPAATVEATAASTAAATEQPALSEAPTTTSKLEDLAFASAAAFADDDGDLWLQLQLEAPLDVDPDTLAFVYSFVVGAAVQTESGYSGVYYSVGDGSSYAEAVFGSADFPRTSTTFNASFQIAQADLWITDDGRLAIHVLGDAAGNGLDAGLFGPDSTLIAGTTVVEEAGGPGSGGFEELTLGPITTGASFPLANWTEVEPLTEPLQLNVPDTSNSN